MTTLIAIPARYASTRYPGKPLVSLKGPGVRWEWVRAIGKGRGTLHGRATG